MEIIQWFNEPSWSQDVVLGGDLYRVAGKYNPRDDSWYCDVLDSSGESLVLGRRVTIGTDILSGVSEESRPNGILLVTPVVEGVLDVSRDNMGVDVKLIFAGYDEIF